MRIRSHVARSSASSEEVTTSVTPWSRFSDRKISSTRSFAPTSMPRVGSFTKRSRGSSVMARAMQTFC
jgi:hypothetical protein